MQPSDNEIIVMRFFEALDRIIELGLIRGKQTFTRRYGINRWNMLTLRKEPGRGIFQPAWLTYLVRDFMVSPRWLLTGEGGFFAPGWDAEKVKSVCKSVRTKI